MGIGEGGREGTGEEKRKQTGREGGRKEAAENREGTGVGLEEEREAAGNWVVGLGENPREKGKQLGSVCVGRGGQEEEVNGSWREAA